MQRNLSNNKSCTKYTYYKDNLDIFELVRTMKKTDPYSFDESFFICDVSDVLQKYDMWRIHMPRVSVFYAVKCNNNSGILEVLANSGTGFDCASKQEIMQVRKLGVHGHRIIYAHPVKQLSHLLYAKSQGVKKLTVDTQNELFKIKDHYPDAELIIRIRYDDEQSQIKLGLKYGCDPIEEAPKLLVLAKKLELNVIGVSFHVGCMCKNYIIYAKAIEAAKYVFDFAKTVGMNLTLLDIGGGYPNDVQSLEEIGSVVKDALELFFPFGDVTIISEPGRYMVSTAMTLITKVHSTQDVYVDGILDKMTYFINDSIYGSFCNIPWGEKPVNPQYVLFHDDVGKSLKSKIWGQTCDSADKILDDIMLPKMEVDDVLIFKNLGAYTVPLLSVFNGFPKPKIKLFLNIKHKYN